MNIQPQKCPYGHGKTRFEGTESSPGAPKVLPKDDGKFTIDDIICPFQRVAFNEGALKVDADGNATNLPEVLKKFAGAGFGITAVANHAAKKLTHDGNIAAWKADDYNLQDLEGSHLDHTADTRILRGGFNQERLDAALSFSSDGVRLTEADLRRFQKKNVEEEPGKKGEFVGGAEMALLIKVFGRTDALGTKFIKNKDLVTIYRDAKWPEGWEPPKPGSLNFWSTGVAVRDFLTADGTDGGAETLAQMNQAPQKGAGVCPFISGQPYDMAEAAKQHSDKLQ